jgi:hypothetical protein
MSTLAPVRGAVRALLLACAAVVLIPSFAHADAPIVKLFAGPIAPETPCYPNLDPKYVTPPAGSFVDFCAAYYVSGGAPAGDDPKSVTFDTPQGFTATSQISPQCKIEAFAPKSTADGNCAPNTKIGDGQAWIRIDIGGIVIAQSAKVSVYNLDYTDKEWGRVGLQLEPELGGIKLPRSKLVARITIRPWPDVGLRTVIDDLPRTADLGLGTMQLATDGFALRFFGSKNDHPNLEKSFGYLGTDCSRPQVTTATSTAYDGTVSSQRSEYQLTDCASLKTGVTANLDVADPRPDVASQVTAAIRPAFDTGERAASYLRKTTITLPPGVAIAGQLASGPDGLKLCSAADYGRTEQRSATCPANTSVGDVEFTSPNLQGVFSGDVFLGEQREPGGLPDIYIQVEQSKDIFAARAKIVGTMRWNDQHQIVTEFDDLPQLPFGEFKLILRGGDHGVLSMPRACGDYSGSVVLEPSNGAPNVTTDLPIRIDKDCIDPNAFQPTIGVTTSSSQAGAAGAVTTISIVRPDRQARIKRLEADLPPGVLADLNGVASCTTAQLNAAACPAESRIGGVKASVGVGPAPLVSSGDVYLMDPPAGAAAGVGILAPVRFGDVDLGVLGITARIDLRQSDFGLRFSADVPDRYRGFPLEVQRLDVALDRPGFGKNPTSCEPLVARGTLLSDLGATAGVEVPLRYEGCGSLAFRPTIATELTGDLTVASRPGVSVRLQLPAGDGAIRRAKVTLPAGLATDLEVPKRACAESVWVAGQCPAAAVVGQAEAAVSILPETLRGAVSLVKVPGSVLPGVGVQFTGRFASRIIGKLTVASTGQLVAEFASVPDVPITRLDLSFASGPTGALQVTSALCETGSYGFQAEFTSQTGATSTLTTKANCPVGARATLSARLGSTLRVRITPSTGRTVRRATLTLPAGVTVKRSAADRRGRLRGVIGPWTITRRSARTLVVVPKSSVRGAFTVVIPKGALAFTRAAKARTTHVVRVTATLSDGTSQAMRVSFGG